MSQQSALHIPEWTPADRLRKARVEAGLTQAELAERIGIAENTVGNYETGATTNLRRIVVKAWALATFVPVEWIMTGTAPTTTPDGTPGEQDEPPTKWNVTALPTMSRKAQVTALKVPA